MRWIVRIAGVLLGLMLLAIGSLALIPSDKIANIAVGQFNTLTGRTLTLTGAVRPSIWPQLGVRTGPVAMSNAPWSDNGPMLQAEGLAISVDMTALIAGEVRITAIEAITPQIVLERSADGAENWVFGGPSGGTVTSETPGVGAPFTLDRATISDGSVTYIDHATGTRHTLTAITGVVQIPDYTGPADMQIAASLNGQSFRASAGISVFRDFLDGRLVDLKLTLEAASAKVTFDGRAGTRPLMAEGRLDADLGDLTAVATLAGISRPALPQGLGANGVAVTGAITLTPEASVHLRGGKVTLDGNVLATEIDLSTAGETPSLSAQIRAGALNLSALAGGGGGEGTDTPSSGWSRDPIDASALSLLDATVAFSADSIDTGFATLGTVQTVMTLDRGRAVFDIARITAYEGMLAGQFVVNARKGLSVGGDLTLTDLAVQPLLADLAGYDRLIGTGNLAVKFLGVGGSLDAILRSLDGSGALSLGRGELRGLDIAGMIATLDTSYVGEGQKTIFDGITASFAMAGGVLTNDDLSLQAPLLTATGKGAVDLGAQTLDYRLQPTLLTGDQQGVTVPLLISGPWANPSVQLDLEGLAAEKLAEEAAKLEAAARARAAELETAARERAKELEAEARAKLEAELGVVQGEGESLEDAARRRAEEALKEEAAKALGGLFGNP